MRCALISVVLVALAGGCERPQPTATTTAEPRFAKPPSGTTPTLQVTIPDRVNSDPLVANAIRGDGRGPYVSGQCGVSVTTGSNGTTGWPTVVFALGAKMSPRQARACADGPRTATFDIDGTAYDLGSIKVNLQTDDDPSVRPGEGEGVVNAGTSCVTISESGQVSGPGLRFQPRNYPGSETILVAGSGYDWHIHTASNALDGHDIEGDHDTGYCENNAGTSFPRLDWDLSVEVSGF